MKKILKQFQSEDWIIVFAGAVILLMAYIFPDSMPKMPTNLSSSESWKNAATLFIWVTAIVVGCNLLMKRKVTKIIGAMFAIFVLALGGQLLANIPEVKELGFESVFFSVILGLIISNFFKVPKWLKPAIQSEFYIKIGIVCLGSTILFGEVVNSGIYGLLQSVIVVFTVWNFTFWLAKKMKIDSEMGTMLSSAVSICGVSAAIATCGVINGDNKKLSYVISLVLVCAIPMMYILPPIAQFLGLGQEMAGAWLGGTIDTTGAVAASGTMLGETAAQTAIIVKSSQNVLLGVAAFAISLFWSYKGKNQQERPTLGVIWDRFPKFVVGFIISSLVFSFLIEPATAKAVGSISKSMTNTLFGLAFVCIGLETNFKDLFSRSNRKPMVAFLVAQSFNILVTLVVAYIMFGLLKPYMANF